MITSLSWSRWNIIILLMQSLTWQHARKHQTNTSPSKATHAFTKDSRFRSARNLLYLLSYTDATPSITSPQASEKDQLQVLAEATKLKLLTRISTLLLLRITMSSQQCPSQSQGLSLALAEKYPLSYVENQVQWHFCAIGDSGTWPLLIQNWVRYQKRLYYLLKTSTASVLKLKKSRTCSVQLSQLSQRIRKVRP